MLSDNANELARELRSHVVPDRVGVGPDVAQLVKLWGSRDPAQLRPAMDELEGLGFILIDKRLGAPQAGIPPEFAVREVAGVQVTEELQDYLDNSP